MKYIRSAALAAVIIMVSIMAACSVPAGPAGSPVQDVTSRPVCFSASPSQETEARQTPAPTPEPTPEPTAHMVYSDGISIDGINLKGLTREDAKAQIAAQQKPLLDKVGVTLQYGDKTWKFTSRDVNCTFNTDEVINNAWDLSERNYSDERDGETPPPIMLKTTLSVDASPIEDQVRNLAFSFYVPFVNSAFAGYDQTKPDGSRLSFTAAKPGKQVDADKLWAAVQKEFAGKTFGTVPVTLEDVPAKITAQDWLNNLKLVSRFVTVQSHTPERYTNVKVACSQITGHFIMPGEVFSFNGTTGPRTADKGYVMAHVINGGVIDNGLAGGTCQVSGTLFNAAARAGLTIVERHHHTLKSTYLSLGQDATVDFGHYDLKLQNDSDSPVLIVMYEGTGKNKWNVYAEIYGKPLPKGETIELVSKITETVPAPLTVSFVTSTAVKQGTTETVKPHVGWKVTTYRQYKQNGKIVKSVVLYQDYYKEAGTIVVYNPADPQPTLPPSLATPTPSAAPSAKPSPTPKPH